MFNRIPKGLIAIIIASIFMAIVALPNSTKESWPGNWFTNLFKNPKIILGLDLQGGTQLDYRIDLRNVHAKNEDDDKSNDVSENDIIEGVRTTIERRVNGLGVSEPQIYLSDLADEKHIIVELAGIKDVEEAKAVVGKTIQLEFKEPKTEVDPEEESKIKEEANGVLEQVSAEDADFEEIGNNVKTSDKKIDFRPNEKKFVSQLPMHYKEVLPELESGQIHSAVIEGNDGFIFTPDGQFSEKTGFFIVKLLNKEIKDHTKQEASTFEEVVSDLGKTLKTLNDKKRSDFEEVEANAIWALKEGRMTDILEAGDELRVYKLVKKQVPVKISIDEDGNTVETKDEEAEEQVRASHILIAYEGSERANPEVTRSKEDAKKRAEEVAEKAKADPEQFGELAKEYSDGPSGPKGGDLGFFKRGVMTKTFEDAAFFIKKGEVSEVVETEFGYHVIKVVDKKGGVDFPVDVELLTMETSARSEFESALAKMELHDVTVEEEEFEFSEIFFDTSPDPWKSTGLDGSHFKQATVTYGQLNEPQVSILFDSEGGDMFAELTGRLVDKQLAIFVGGELISAPRVNQKIVGGSAVITGKFSIPEALQLATDLNTGAIDAPVILSGQYTISATLGENALRVSLIAGLIGLILLAIYMLLFYRLMGLLAVIALLIYSIIIVFILKTTGIVMTLAGIAGIILSIGMAVDANILIFERTKEELNTGKNFTASITAGFERAWSSIYDSNVSSLITCAILWFFGNSIIRGFALMLAIGILVSMFTAITVTRKFLQALTGTSLSKNRFLLGAKEVESVNR